jgi:hypothetical protein
MEGQFHREQIVEARVVTDAESITTSGGDNCTAEVGQVVITEDNGAQWVVTHNYFQAYFTPYEPKKSEPKKAASTVPSTAPPDPPKKEPAAKKSSTTTHPVQTRAKK